SLALYLALGVAGLPIFAGAGAGFSPSFGFIIGFVPAAALIGWLSERSWDRRPALALLGFLAASIVPFLVGVPYLAMALGALGLPNDLHAVLQAGVIPFIPGGIVKWLIAAAALPLLWKLVRAADTRAR
ncbi:biotin transporter BioY, partial [Leucobacter sp. M11]|uniref:biotin transporter BioY n=1 Tax=Leucobacter sp. M11 TaxID=2993565 RepID=UPI002D803AF4